MSQPKQHTIEMEIKTKAPQKYISVATKPPPGLVAATKKALKTIKKVHQFETCCFSIDWVQSRINQPTPISSQVLLRLLSKIKAKRNLNHK